MQPGCWKSSCSHLLCVEATVLWPGCRDSCREMGGPRMPTRQFLREESLPEASWPFTALQTSPSRLCLHILVSSQFPQPGKVRWHQGLPFLVPPKEHLALPEDRQLVLCPDSYGAEPGLAVPFLFAQRS